MANTPSAPIMTSGRQGLLGAIKLGSTEKIVSYLDDDPDAAWMPMLDFGAETPICAAVRLGCPTQVIDLLMARGGDPTMVDKFGKNALEILASRPRCALPTIALSGDLFGKPSRWLTLTEEWMLKVAMRLLAGGCNPSARNRRGESPVGVAASAKWLSLSALLGCWDDLKVCQVLHHTLRKESCPHYFADETSIRKLPNQVLKLIFKFVLSQEVTDMTTSEQS